MDLCVRYLEQNGKEEAMSTEEERRILDDIKKTGYPLEVDVARLLMEKGWGVFPQWVYSDERTKKIRTIDMLVMPFVTEPTILLNQSNIYRWPIIILECKKSKKPWHACTHPMGSVCALLSQSA